MKMELFSLVSSSDFPATKLQIKIAGSLNTFTDSDIMFNKFSTIKEMFPALAAALKSAELIVIAIEPKLYNKTRQKLCSALSLKTEINQIILSHLKSNAGLSDEETAQNAVMPQNATVFVTKDGINSGFSVKKGRQEIMLIPLDNQRIDVILRNGVIPYLTSGETISQSKENPVHDEPLPEPEKTPAEEPEEVPVTRQPSVYKAPVSDDTAVRTINILKENGCSVAVSGNQNSEYIKSFGGTATDFFSYFSFTPHVEDKGDFNITDYTAQMAKSSRELASASLGACISDISDTDDCSFICIAVAGESSAVVRKLYKEDDETDESFIKDAAEELIALIGEKASGNSSVGIEISQNNISENEKGFWSKKSGKATLAVIIILLIAGLCVGGFFLKKYMDKKSAETTTVPPVITTTEPTTEPVTEPKETILLSQMMFNEAMSGVNKDDLTTTSSSANQPGTTAGAIAAETTTSPDTNKIPDKIMLNGKETDAKEAVAKMVAAEIDDSYNSEAIKAQAVVIYTYLKYRGTNFNISGVTTADAVSDNITNAVNAVFGEYVSYDDAAAFTPFFKLSAGKTTASDAVFGKSYPYLKTVSSTSDKNETGYKTEKEYLSEQLKEYITKFDSTITLSDKPSEWLKVKNHDGAINTGVGYVETITIGDKEISGLKFKTDVLNSEIPSHCFSVTYSAGTDKFKITSYGDGLGVGMSLLGANKMAASGSNYTQILSRYYPGTKLS